MEVELELEGEGFLVVGLEVITGGEALGIDFEGLFFAIDLEVFGGNPGKGDRDFDALVESASVVMRLCHRIGKFVHDLAFSDGLRF